MRAVFDLDDTICVHTNRDYPNAKPIKPVIEKMRAMKKDGWEIIIYSARGQVSCKGDLALIEERNRAVVETWLREHDVPCDELIFGKPIGDIYIDDKGLSLVDFLKEPFYVLHGGSGKQVYRIGNIVRKDFGTEEETAEYARWIATCNGEFLFPRVISRVYNTVYMEYINGARGCDVDASFVPALVERVCKCKDTSPQEFDIKPHIERLALNMTGDAQADALLNRVVNYLKGRGARLSEEGSFCHGDLILSNTIIRNGEVYVVDARNTTGANSYLLDLAKLRMSLNGYERIFGISDIDNSCWCDIVDKAAKSRGLYEDVIALEVMFIFRCYRYVEAENRPKLVRYALQEGKLLWS